MYPKVVGTLFKFSTDSVLHKLAIHSQHETKLPIHHVITVDICHSLNKTLCSVDSSSFSKKEATNVTCNMPRETIFPSRQ